MGAGAEAEAEVSELLIPHNPSLGWGAFLPEQKVLLERELKVGNKKKKSLRDPG